MPNLDYILATKFQGTITSEEDAWLNSWLNESDENKSIYKQASKLWDELGFSSSDFTQDRQVAWEMIVSSIKPETTSPKPQLYKLIVNMVVVIVALFVVMGIASTFLTYNANQQEVAKVRNHRVALPDRSDVYLDSLASVKYAKRMGKKGFHLGGSLQLLFGIRGKRWDNPDYNPDYNFAELINEHWVKPGTAERPANADKVEGACYW